MKRTWISLPTVALLITAAIISCAGNTSNADETTSANTNRAPVTDSLKTVSLQLKANPLLPEPLNAIRLPEGFHIAVYAKVQGARSMALSDNGTLYVGTMGKNVYAVVDEDKDGKADQVYTVAKNLNTPNGVAWKNGDLYIATISSILKLEKMDDRLQDPPAPVKVYDQYPTDRHHGWKFIAFGPDDKLYVPVGAPCNICESKNPVYASITRIHADGSNMEIFAKGVRNTVGFTWHPETKHLWFTDNGRDNMGDDMPADELNTAPTSGMHFGYPYCHQGNTLDPEFGKGKSCDDYVAPVQNLTPHGAALGLRFNTGNQFPASFKNSLFIAEHGSWNRSEPIGYRVGMVQLDASGKSTGFTTFADGWLQPGGKVTGRPVDVQFLQDGSMLISDDYSNLIYRVTYKP
ncbi:MAG: sorbosone dehydrogenase family protein [Ferruginibacter sp.]|nr:sorbosone dehydrogenase family protein [Ferruginibacter sp.]